MKINLYKKIKSYQYMVIFSLFFTLLGFSYNVWRMELTEENENSRTACFELLLVLSELEQLVYSAYYDQDLNEGSPRKGWVKVGLIVDLSVLTSINVEQSAQQLKQVWSDHWVTLDKEQTSVDAVISSIDFSRTQIKILLKDLK